MLPRAFLKQLDLDFSVCFSVTNSDKFKNMSLYMQLVYLFFRNNAFQYNSIGSKYCSVEYYIKKTKFTENWL